MIEVTDEDRNVAAQYTSREYAGEVEALARIIARYRRALENETRERCAKEAERWCTSKAAAGMRDSTAAAIQIATAIRATQARPAEQRG